MILQNSLSAKVLTSISLVLLIFLFGCKDDEMENRDIKMGLYLNKYMNYPSHVYPEWYSTNYTYINANIGPKTYSDTTFIDSYKNKIIKRWGWDNAINPISWAFYSKDIYDTLIYTTNQLTILTKSKSPNITQANAYKKVIYYENGRISKTVQSYHHSSDPDIIVLYTYTDNLLTKKIGYKFGKIFFQSDLYYNKDRNLDSIITRESRYNYDTDTLEIDFSSGNRTKESFENYDNNKNPLTAFVVFDETFNRSLSVNNYRKYNYYYFTTHDQISHEWHFTYDLPYENEFVNFGR